MGRFAQDTAVEDMGAGTYGTRIDEGWWIQRGPNGGYLAAIVLRALQSEVADPARRPRSLTLHYLRPPVAGPATVEVEERRAGRTMSTMAARLHQGGKVCIEALGAFGTARPGLRFDEVDRPDIAPPAELDPPPTGPADIPMRDRYEYRHGIGAVPGGAAGEALTGGWIRLAEDEPVDDVVVAALTDSWAPAVFSRLTAPVAVPTVDLTIHFREEPPARPGWCLVRFRSRLAADGYLDEEGEVWSDDGRLLAQSRQLAVILGPG